jgi:hypothetical protein
MSNFRALPTISHPLKLPTHTAAQHTVIDTYPLGGTYKIRHNWRILLLLALASVCLLLCQPIGSEMIRNQNINPVTAQGSQNSGIFSRATSYANNATHLG